MLLNLINSNHLFSPKFKSCPAREQGCFLVEEEKQKDTA